ncbi:MAG TPA: AGE family epimerase/isomerase [Chitinophagaceae bacterium]|nr:AGE family epimerase/isomerase [Chitinophagaceae bacterium]
MTGYAITDEMLLQYKKELQQELGAILSFWQEYATDHEFGGFYGRMDNSNHVFNNAPKGAVLNARILWAFSAAYNLTANESYLESATRAFEYFINYFIDGKNGGVYWTIDYQGFPLDTRKQIYALSFAVYGLSEYYLAAKSEEAKQAAIRMYDAIVMHSYDLTNGGYIEALSADWKPLHDLRLSEKDANEKKSMNTHLHVLEGFANLYRSWADEVLKKRIAGLIHIFFEHIIDPETHHLKLFFDEEWHSKSRIISYGHDIEAAWLILEAVEIIGDPVLMNQAKIAAIQMANAAAEGLDTDGGLWYEYNSDSKHWIREKHSWPQAESMIGFFNAWQITGQEKYLQISLDSWTFIQKFILDKANGEWFWGITQNYSIMNEDKVGLWKCPYHNSRACIELIKRIHLLKND